MSLKRSKLILLFSISSIFAFPASGFAEDAGAQQGKGEKNTLEARIKRQHNRIREGLEKGSINKAQATQLNSGLDDLQAKIDTQKQKNGGHLKPEERKQAENSLNQSNDVIRSYETAGSSKVESGKVLGPKWSAGQDGAQNSKSLLKQMKSEERRELRQEKQANEQKLEQQQLDYEKSMMTKFSDQRKNILNKKTDLKQVRQDSGAN